MSGERFYGDYLVAPWVDFKNPPRGGKFAESLNEPPTKLKIINPLSARVRIRVSVLSETLTLTTLTCSMARLRIINPSWANLTRRLIMNLL